MQQQSKFKIVQKTGHCEVYKEEELVALVHNKECAERLIELTESALKSRGKNA